MKKKIAKLGIIAVLTFALILSSLGALPFGDTLAKEFDIGAKNQTTAQAATTWDGSTKTAPTGTGTADSPYLIGTAEQLAYVADKVNTVTDYSKDKFFKLTANIELNDTTGWAGWTDATADLNAWTPIGDATNQFKGTFDGADHTVSGIYISGSADNQGLFGKTYSTATLQNVGVINSYIKGKENVGGVVGSSQSGKIIGCYNTGMVSGAKHVGGVVGRNAGEANKCYNLGAVSGTENVGGVAGFSIGAAFSPSTVINCYNTGNVTGTTNVGGVAGQVNNYGVATNCYNTGAVSSTGNMSNVGGVVGYNNEYGEVINCYNNGAVSSTGTGASVGGVAGKKGTNAKISYSHFLKTPTTNNELSAIPAGDVTGGASFGDDGALTPALTIDEKNCTKLFDALNAGATEYNTTEPGKKIPATEWSVDSNGKPTFKVEGSVTPPAPTPITPAANFAGGNGSKETPYLIGTPEELAYLAQLVNANNTEHNAAGVHYKLTANIVLNDTANWTEWGTTAPAKVWIPIGNYVENPDPEGVPTLTQFLGSFDGDGHTVSGIYINAPTADCQGLFGIVGNDTVDTATIKNLGVINSYINGKEYVGGVVGDIIDGKVINCYNTGKVSGLGYIGGVVGRSIRNAKGISEVTNCYNRGAVSATNDYVGGVIGFTNASGCLVTNCYNAGAVTGRDYLGGIVGALGNFCKMINCYFLKNEGSTLDASGETAKSSESYNCSPFGTNKKLTIEGKTDPNEGNALVAFAASADLLATLNLGTAAYNKTDPAPATPAMAWADGADGYPAFTAGGVTPPPEPTKPFAKGEGTATAPYEISTAQELIKLSELINAADATYSVAGVHYKLTADIKLNGDKIITSTSTGVTAWNSIGNYDNPFLGVFDGQGFTVSGIYIDSANNFQGLFGFVWDTATVKNVGVINSYIKGAYNVGGVVGGARGSIINCYNTGAVTGSQAVGGVVGVNIGTTINCYNAGKVDSTEANVGGVVGSSNGVVANCYNRGAVSGKSNVGDVVGSNTGSGTTVANCYFSIESGLSAVGVNETNSHVTNCATFNSRKKLTADGATPAKTEGALITFKVGAELLTTLNEGAKAYNDDNTSKTQAMAWANGADDYPTLKAVVTPPTPPAGGGDSDSEPSISPEDIFWTGIVTDLKLKDEPVVEFNCKYPRMSRRVLVALQEVDKTLNINLNGEKISLTSKQVKPLTFDKATYSVAELKALLEKPEVTPTPTPTPTEKPTEPTEPTEPTAKKCWLCGACPMFLGICLWIWLAIAVVAVAVVVVFIVLKKKKKNDKK